MLRRKSAGPDGRSGQRVGPRIPVGDSGRPYPSIFLLFVIAVCGWLTWLATSRIEGAQHTVARGWAVGLAVGIAASAGLTVLGVVLLLGTRRRARSQRWPYGLPATRGRPRSSTWGYWLLTVIVVVSYGICGRAMLPSSIHSAGPYVITTGIGVGEIAYFATYSAQAIALLVWMTVRLYRRDAGYDLPRGHPDRAV